MRVTLYENQFNFLENDTSNIMTDTNDFFYRWRVNDKPIIIPIYHLKKRDVTEVTDINFRLRFSSILNDNYLLDRKPKYTRGSKNNFTILLEELFVESKLNGINFYLTDTEIVPYQNINLLERINEYSKKFDTKNNTGNNDDEGNDIDLSGANRFMEIVFLICHKFESLPMARKLLKRDEYYDFFTNLLSSNISGSTGKNLSIKKLANLIQSASKNSAILPRFDIDIEEMRKRLKHFVKDYSYDLDSTDIEVGEYRVNINLKPNFFGTDKRWLDVSSPDTKTEGEMSSKIKQRIVDDKDLNSLYLIYMGFKLSNL